MLPLPIMEESFHIVPEPLANIHKINIFFKKRICVFQSLQSPQHVPGLVLRRKTVWDYLEVGNDNKFLKKYIHSMYFRIKEHKKSIRSLKNNPSI